MVETAKPELVETSKVSGRRRLRFRDLDEIPKEVRFLSAQPTRQLGNWPLPEICLHLATAMNLSIDGEKPFPVPLKTRFLARLFRNRILNSQLPTGFKLPPAASEILFRSPQDVEEALVALDKGIARLRATSQRAAHPVFGPLNVAQWDLFHLRHSEMHLSFIVPE